MSVNYSFGNYTANFTLPTGYDVLGYFNWTNQIAGTEWAIAISLFFTFVVLPTMYFITKGHNQTHSAIISFMLGTLVFAFASWGGLVPAISPIIMGLMTGLLILYDSLSGNAVY